MLVPLQVTFRHVDDKELETTPSYRRRRDSSGAAAESAARP